MRAIHVLMDLLALIVILVQTVNTALIAICLVPRFARKASVTDILVTAHMGVCLLTTTDRSAKIVQMENAAQTVN